MSAITDLVEGKTHFFITSVGSHEISSVQDGVHILNNVTIAKMISSGTAVPFGLVDRIFIHDKSLSFTEKKEESK